MLVATGDVGRELLPIREIQPKPSACGHPLRSQNPLVALTTSLEQSRDRFLPTTGRQEAEKSRQKRQAGQLGGLAGANEVRHRGPASTPSNKSCPPRLLAGRVAAGAPAESHARADQEERQAKGAAEREPSEWERSLRPSRAE